MTAAIQSELAALRERVRGVPFAENPEAYKDIEAAKVRLNLARDPEHYERLHAAWFAKRYTHKRGGN